jgi:hypothetical protein
MQSFCREVGARVELWRSRDCGPWPMPVQAKCKNERTMIRKYADDVRVAENNQDLQRRLRAHDHIYLAHNPTEVDLEVDDASAEN